jgi:hypothetical protein
MVSLRHHYLSPSGLSGQQMGPLQPMLYVKLKTFFLQNYGANAVFCDEN